MKIPSSDEYRGIRHYLLLAGEIFKQSYREWRLDRTIRLGAGLAYYAIFAIVPLFVVGLSLASIFFTDLQIQQYLTTQLAEFFGQQFDDLVISLFDQIEESQFEASITSLGVIGLITLVVTASFVFIAFQDALDVIWKSPVTKGVKLSAKRYLLAYAIVMLIGALLAIAIFISVVSDVIESFVFLDSAFFQVLAEMADFLGIWLFGATVLAVLLKTLVKVDVNWGHLFLGSMVTIFFMYMGFYVIGWYLTTFGSTSLTGAIGSVFLVLVWIYYEAQILLAGVQFTKVLAYRLGNKELKKSLARSAT